MLTIVIPTLGRPNEFRQSTAQYFELLDDITDEIIVVVDGAHQPQYEEVRQSLDVRWGDKARWIWNETRLGAAASRNLGAASAQAMYLAFLDDDILLGGSWVESVRDSIERDLHCFTGPVTSHDSPKSLLAQSRELRYRDRYRNLSDLQSVPFLAGGNSIVQRSLFEKAGGFPLIRIASDNAFVARLHSHAAHVTFRSGMLVTHRHDRGPVNALKAAWLAGLCLPNDRPMYGPPRPSIGRGERWRAAHLVNLGLWLLKALGAFSRPICRRPTRNG